jgi:hypothetical protein
MKKFATVALAGALSIASIAATCSVADAHWDHGNRGFGLGFGGFGLGLGLGLLANPYNGYGPYGYVPYESGPYGSGYYGPGYYNPYSAPAPSCWRWSHRWHRRIWVCG